MVCVVITIPYFPYSCVITAYKGNIYNRWHGWSRYCLPFLIDSPTVFSDPLDLIVQSFAFSLVFCQPFFFCIFVPLLGHCIMCPSLNYGVLLSILVSANMFDFFVTNCYRGNEEKLSIKSYMIIANYLCVTTIIV